MNLPPLPAEPAHVGRRMDYYSAAQVSAYTAAAVLAERERCADLCEQWDATHPARLAAEIRKRPNVRAKRDAWNAALKAEPPLSGEPVATDLARAMLKAAEWQDAPRKTEYGAGMLCADAALTKDETMTICIHRDALYALYARESP